MSALVWLTPKQADPGSTEQMCGCCYDHDANRVGLCPSHAAPHGHGVCHVCEGPMFVGLHGTSYCPLCLILEQDAARTHYKRESETGGAMLAAIVTGLGLDHVTTTRDGTCVQDVLGVVTALKAEVTQLRHWVDDLQAGMYINCVYCGHRYGPDNEVPATMAQTLKDHIEQCPSHPMSALKMMSARAMEIVAAARMFVAHERVDRHSARGLRVILDVGQMFDDALAQARAARITLEDLVDALPE